MNKTQSMASRLLSVRDRWRACYDRVENRGDDVYLCRSSVTPEQVQSFFHCVMARVDKLSQSLEKYNTIINNCLTNIRYQVNRI